MQKIWLKNTEQKCVKELYEDYKQLNRGCLQQQKSLVGIYKQNKYETAVDSMDGLKPTKIWIYAQNMYISYSLLHIPYKCPAAGRTY